MQLHYSEMFRDDSSIMYSMPVIMIGGHFTSRWHLTTDHHSTLCTLVPKICFMFSLFSLLASTWLYTVAVVFVSVADNLSRVKQTQAIVRCHMHLPSR